MENEPFWAKALKPPACPAPDGDVSAEVLVIGAGITGVTLAYQLSHHGISTAVIDAGAIGSGETACTTAHLTAALDDGYHAIEKLHGAEKAARAAESHRKAIDSIESMVALERLDCDFERVDGHLVLDPSEKNARSEIESLRDQFAREMYALTGTDARPDPVIAAAATVEQGISVVIDLAGNDTYRASPLGLATGRLGVGLLIDRAGDDRYELAQGTGGAGFAGAAGMVTV